MRWPLFRDIGMIDGAFFPGNERRRCRVTLAPKERSGYLIPRNGKGMQLHSLYERRDGGDECAVLLKSGTGRMVDGRE